MDIEETKPNTFCVHDLFLDIKVNQDGAYEILDEEDYQEALRLEIMTERQVMRSVLSLKMALNELAAGEFPSARLKTLIDRYLNPVNIQRTSFVSKSS